MAINFGDTIMEGGIEPSVRVQSPVQDDSGAVLAESLGGVAKTVGAIAGSIFQQNETNAADKILSTYQTDLLNLADDVDQGMDRGEALIRARALQREYLANSPALREDFGKIWTSFATESGLGHVVIEGTLEQQAFDAKTTEAIKSGYSSVQEYDAFLNQARQHELLMQQASAATAKNTILSETQRNGLITSAVGLADKAFPAAENQIRTAMAAIEAGGDRATIAAELNNSLGNSINLLRSKVGGEGTDYIITPITGLLETFNQWATSGVENSVLEGAITNTKQQYAAMFASDPTLGPIIAQSALLNDLGLAQTKLGIEMWSPEALKKLRDVGTGNLSLIDGTEASNRAASNIVEIAGTITSTSSPELIQETMDFVNAAVDGVWKNERNAEGGALGFKDTVEMLGSPQVGALIEKAGGITAAHADQFVQILEDNYANELTPAIRAYWESVPIQTPTAGEQVIPQNIPMNQLLQPVWNGSTVEFLPKEQYKADPRIISLAADINSGSNSIGIPLNNLINAYANVTGQDAKTIWENDFAGRLFNLGPDGKPVEVPLADSVNAVLDATTPEDNSGPLSFTTTEDLTTSPNARELTIEDFQPEELEAIVQQTSAVNPEGVIAAGSPMEFAQSFLGLNEENTEQAQVLSSFIRSAAGININPAQTAWCAAFVDAILHASGRGGGTGALNAQSYLKWGRAVSQPQVGDIVVFQRGAPGSGLGHVGFFAGMNNDGTIKVLGGNQSNSVSFSDYEAANVLGYRRAE